MDRPGVPVRAGSDQTGLIAVGYVKGEQYEIRARGHSVPVDQPPAAGGGDCAPTPTELFVGALGACVAFYAGRYLARHGFGREGLTVATHFDMATDRPARVAKVRMVVHPPVGFPAERVAALVAVASHCTVHNSLTVPPEVTVTVE